MHVARDILRAAFVLWALLLAVPGAGASPADVIRAMHVPAGFTIEVAAEAPLVRHPMWACFDDRGRLFVAESGGLNLNAEDLQKNPPSSILLLEDDTGGGHFDKSTVFADKMVFPQGVCWHDGALYVASPPYLWRLRDTKGTGIADERTPLVGKFGFTGNAADIHGPVLGPDGRLYWCDGRHGHDIKFSDGKESKGLAARIFRCKPDGSDVEVVCGGGMDNPVQVAFTATGEPLVSCNLVRARPQRVDGILYALEGAVFPWNEALNEFKSTGELFEPVDPLGWVAVSGLIRYRGDAFGNEFRDNFFSAQFNPHRIQRHIFERDGAGFRARNEDFLTCDDADFHPTAVVEDADGSLLVIDTGGWFRIGCPNSRIAKPQIEGAIYRIRRKNAPPIDDPRGLKIEWTSASAAQLGRLLDDSRPMVVARAIDNLAMRGADGVATLSNVLGSDSIEARRNSVWTLARIDRRDAAILVRRGMTDVDASVRQAAVQIVGLNRDASAKADLIKGLSDQAIAVRRDAATALGRIGRTDATVPLLAALRGNTDPYLDHAIIFALIRLANTGPLESALRDPDPSVRRGAVLALDQIDGSGLKAEQVLPLLDPAEPRLKDAALSVFARHAGWADQMLDYFHDALARPIEASQADPMRQELLSFSQSPRVSELIARSLADSSTPPPTRRLLLQVMAQSPQMPVPGEWVAQIGKSIESNQSEVAEEAVLCARSLGLTEVDSELTTTAGDTSRSQSLRVEAFSAAAPRVPNLDAKLFELLTLSLGPDRPPLLRAEAAEALGRSNLNDDQLQTLAGLASVAGPMELGKLLPAFEKHPDDRAGKALIASLDHSPGFASLRPDELKAALSRDSADVQALAEPLLKRLSPNAAGQKAHLAELAPVLTAGDANRGHEVFFGAKAGCATCHTVGGRGGQVGPDLSKIGSIRSPADLLESIVYPSASFARGFEPYTVRTKNGDVQAGIITRETADSIDLTTGPRQVARIARSSIDIIRPGKVSLMPQGFDQVLTRGELSDVIAYLKSLKS